MGIIGLTVLGKLLRVYPFDLDMRNIFDISINLGETLGHEFQAVTQYFSLPGILFGHQNCCFISKNSISKIN
jgi:hypothetical protein